MQTLPTAVQTIDLREPIPGYLLGERLGAGGFGEVWRAEAPGGLAKAVKIVFGQMQGDRAEQELNALQKIKEVRHPMLLSLERIESVAEHLVIVMELADGSLRDRQAEREEAGLPGIPREELLAYLRDAADAMDYLVEHHSLLHLDIKPENLLLVADRVKVADFGLMRELDEAKNASMAGGMTPLYAAPEIFDGKPHRMSDQYSLAIVYQELLTGQPPFAGRTPAQLISQHLHSQPNLKPLPTFDQAVIGRALSKIATRRFPNCRALVDELANAPQTAERTQVRRTLSDSEQAKGTWRNATGRSTWMPDRLAQTDLVSLAFPVATDVHNLPPVEIEADQTFARPTLFLGVGEMGSRVLCDVKRRLRDRFGSIDDAPALQFLALETDPKSLANMSADGQDAGLRFHESLLLPLLEPQDYRAKSSTLLEWMNRRWLYNIPRSRKTEGIRALGRLAFVDHFGPIVDALHTAIAMAMAPESLEMTTRRTGLHFASDAPRVFVVGSTTGGTGSGMLLDLGYTLRTLFTKMEIPAADLAGVLAFATPQRAKARDLAVANTLALLAELRQYSSGNYPGEPACDLPAFGEQPPFDSTYFVQLGELSDRGAFERSMAEVSEYLLLNAATPAANFFDQCRQGGTQPDAATVRTMGLRQRDCQSSNALTIATESLTGALFSAWGVGKDGGNAFHLGNSDGASKKAESLAAKFVEMFGLTETDLFEKALGLISGELGQDTRQFIRKALNEIWVQSARLEPDQRLLDAIEAVDRLVGASIDGSTTTKTESLSDIVQRQMQANGGKTQAALQDWLAKLIDTPTLRVGGALEATAWLLKHFKQLEEAANQQLHRLKADIECCQSNLRAAAEASAADDAERILVSVDSPAFQDLLQYATATLEAACIRRGIRVWQSLREVTQENERRLQGLSTSLRDVAGNLIASLDMLSANRGSTNQPQLDTGRFQASLPSLLNKLDRELDQTYLGQLLALDDLAKGQGIDLEKLKQSVERRARSVVRGYFRESAAVGLGEQATYDNERFAECVNAALPDLMTCGGAKRLLVSLPVNSGLDAATVRNDARLTDESATMLVHGESHVTVCFEVEEIPLDNVAVSLIRNRGDYLELAARLHTRIDVDWKPFEVAISDPS